MIKYFLILSLFLASCVTDRSFNTSNICDIFKTNPKWKSYTESTKEKWGVPVSLQLSFIKHESSFQRTARPPRKKVLGIIPGLRASSAYGYSQALDGTWEEYKKATGNSKADRKNFEDASDFIGWYIEGYPGGVGHNGGEYGVVSNLYIKTSTNVAVGWFANSEVDENVEEELTAFLISFAEER